MPISPISPLAAASLDTSWTFAPMIIFALLAYLMLYVWRWEQCRTPEEPHPPSVWRLVSFSAGIACLVAALVSPIDALGEQLLVMHMVQHVLLLDLAPILMLAGFTRVLLRPITPYLLTIERRAGVVASPAFAVVLYVVAMWAWHVPAMYDAAARNEGIHALEHISFLVAGLLYWWHLISPIRSRMRRGGTGPLIYMGTTKLLVGALGIALTFVPTVIYPFYEHLPEYWGLSALDEQALAGLVMALEQSVVMGIAIVLLFMKMIDESEREEQRAERYEVG